MYFTNITGGEPFIRTDLKDIVRELYKKSDRIVISTNGFLQIVLWTFVKSSLILAYVFPLKDLRRQITKYEAFRMVISVDMVR